VTIDRGDLSFAFVRGSGPGGQAVNKLSTAAQLHVRVGAIRGLAASGRDRLRRSAGARLTAADEIVLRSRRHRSQIDNRCACIERLRELVAAAVIEPKVRRKRKPSKAAKERRLEGKRRESEKKGRRRWSE
jgi:ribosome-associated protein